MTRPYESYLIAGKQGTDWDTGCQNSDLAAVIYEFRRSGLKSVTEFLKSSRFKRNPSAVRQVENFVTAEGDIEMDLHADNMVMWIQQLLMTAAGFSSTDFTAKELRASAVYTSPVTLTTQPTATSPSCSPGKLIFTWTQSRAHTVETVRTNGTFSSPVILTSQPAVPSKLIFTWAIARGHDGGVSKNMTITGTDTADAVLVEVLAVANGASTVTTLGVFKTVSGIVLEAGFDATGNLKIEANTTNTITVTGTDQNDRVLTETISVPFGATTVTSTYYYKSVGAAGIVMAAGFDNTDSLKIEGDKNTYSHVMTLGDDILDGLTIEQVSSGIPDTAIGCLVNSGTITLADLITFNLSIMAKKLFPNSIVKAGSTGDPTATETPTDVAAFAQIEQGLMAGWASALYLDGAVAGSEQSLASASLTIGNNLNQNKRYKRSRTYSKPNRGGYRDIKFTYAIDWDTSNNDYDADVYNNDVVRADYWAYYMPYGGPEYSIHISMPRCQFVNFPTREISDFTQQLQEITLEPIRTVGATSSDELTITVVCAAAT
jgi:hypothetical protein